MRIPGSDDVSEAAEAEAVAEPYSGRTAWGRNLETPLREFLRTETGSAAVLLGATLAALVWVNVDASSYASLWGTELSIHVGSHGISQDLRGWVNSGLMTFFFFVVGLEARREFDMGELRERRRFAIPLFAGLGGMIVPIAIFLAFNAGRASAHGWGTAMSTDTAFALGLLALVGSHFPSRLRAFLLTVSVVDDVGGARRDRGLLQRERRRAGAPDRRRDLRRDPRRAYGAHPLRVPLLRARVLPARRGDVGRAVRIRSRPGGGRPRRGSPDVRVPRRARRPRAGERPLPDLPRAADARAWRARPGSGSRRRSRRTSVCSSSTTRGRAT